MNATSTAVVQSKPEIHADMVRRLLSFPVAVSALLAVLATVCVRERFADPDMWWHLKMGQVIWTTHHIPTVDTFSYTTNHHAYIPHEWLSQLFIFSAYRLAGYSGLMLWLCCMTAAILVAGYTLCTIYSGNAKVALLGALVIFFFGTVGFSVRPQMVGYLLLLIELLILQLGRTRSAGWFLVLPVLFLVWVNSHGSYWLGIGIAGLQAFAGVFNFEVGLLRAIPGENSRRRNLLVGIVLSVLALLINPSGVKLLLYPLNALFKASIGVANVVEWLPLDFSDVRAFGLIGCFGAVFLIALVRRSELFWDELLQVCLATWMAASHHRLLLVFGILVAPVLCRLLNSAWDRYDPARDHPSANAFLIGASCLVAILAFPNSKSLMNQVQQNCPVGAVNYIHSHHLPGPMLNEWIDGGYLIWAAPDYPVFIDGRGDIFEWAGTMADYRDWALLQANPNQLLEKYHIGFCLLTRTSHRENLMALLPNWRAVYSDRQSIIYVRQPAESGLH